MPRNAFRLPFLMKVTVSTVIFLCLSYVFFVLGPLVETRLFPVVEKLQILKVYPIDDNTSYIYARFTKIRDCEYVGVAWYRGSRLGGFERVLIVLLRAPEDIGSPTRPIGTQTAGPWKVSMNAGAVIESSFVDVHHRCHPFWITRTEWYP